VSYVDSQLLSGETVVYRAHLHRILFVTPTVISGVATVIAAMVMSTGASPSYVPLSAWFVVVGLTSIWAWIDYTSSEFAVTNKRVIMKQGWLRRHSLETLLSKVEGIGVDQTIFGRMLDFGTISVTGTGGTRESFPRIAAPLEFRRQVQDVVSRLEEARAGAVAPANAYALQAPREERDCPFCAERILVKARVCKHCGRDVSAVGV